MKNNLLFAYVIFAAAFLPLSTDMCLPALPEITAYFSAREFETNLTLSLFMLVFTLAMLIWGPLSDKFGRKPVLLIGLGLYTIAGFLCASAQNIHLLIVFRILQAIGGAGPQVLTSAILKDVFVGKKQENAFAISQSCILICPAVAPLIGSLLMYVIGWQGLFVFMGCGGAIFFALGALFYKETLQKTLSVSVIRSFSRLVVVLKHGPFLQMLLIFSVPGMAYLAFVQASSYIYQVDFGTSSRDFSLYFAIVTIGSIVGPALYIFLSRRVMKPYNVVTLAFMIFIVIGVAILFFGGVSPLLLSLFMFLPAMSMSLTRPAGTFLMINLKKDDTGSASSLIASVGLLCGTAGMMLISVLGNYLLTQSFILIGTGLFGGLLWLILFRKDKDSLFEKNAE
jgi:DHA1 family bicyclomycin/chloramphenicol resistance-like MFS transporter